jgi:SOS-response transcriptional repressor LexA
MPVVRAEDRPVTARQEEYLAFIRRFLREHGRPPTIRRIGAAMGGLRPFAVMQALNSLVRKGQLRPDRADGSGWCAYMPVVPRGHCPCCGRAFEDE